MAAWRFLHPSAPSHNTPVAPDTPAFGAWDLELLWNLELGACSFSFSSDLCNHFIQIQKNIASDGPGGKVGDIAGAAGHFLGGLRILLVMRQLGLEQFHEAL